jgi:D-alanyl-D-alanine carboxypeptidase/D-alanyl-D-alanine-endopeptidase (penicillin-binding protein 4)
MFLKFGFAAVLVCFSVSSFAQPSAGGDGDKFSNLQKEFQSLAKKHGVNISDVGMRATIGEGDGLKVLLDVNDKSLMIPASISKVATASTVLAHFPPGYKFKTQLLSDAPVANGVLKGSLFFCF